MKIKEVQRLINEDPDFVYLGKRFNNSLAKVLERFPDGVPNRLIAQGLLITEEEVEELSRSAILKIRQALGVEVENDD